MSVILPVQMLPRAPLEEDRRNRKNRWHIPMHIGSRVKVEYDPYWNAWYVREADFDGLIEQGIHPGIVNTLDPI